jgi:hypothetical protein
MSQPEAGFQIIQAVDYAIHAGKQFDCVIFGQEGDDGLCRNLAVDSAYALGCDNSFFASYCGFGAEQLAVEIALFKHITVDDAQVSHAYARERLDNQTSQAPASDDGDTRLGQLLAFFLG